MPEFNEKGYKLLFYLSPGDLVYVPEEYEHITIPLEIKRIYKTVCFDSSTCYFVPQYWATMIKDKLEFGPKNKSEKNSFGVQIKSKCLKLETDRLGNIVKVIGHD